MKKVIGKLKALRPTRRKIIQLYTALLFNANFKGFYTGRIYKGNTKKICMPGINCYSCPGAVTACPLGSLQGSFSVNRSTLFYVGGILLLYCFIFGRMICGWFCPFGFIQELLYKIKTPKIKKSPITRIFAFFKYFVLVFFVFVIPIMYAFRNTPFPAFCKYICPAGTLEGGVALLSHKNNSRFFEMLGPLFTWKFLLLISIIVASIFIFRIFCRFICPLGALYGLFNKFSVFGVKVDNDKCTYCNRCVNHCKLDIKHVGDTECISCGDCVDICPTKAISWKGTKAFRPMPEDSEKNKKARFISRAVATFLALAVLIGAVIYFWNDDSNATSEPQTQTQTEQNESTDSEYSVNLKIVTAAGITDDTVNPLHTGKITIVNFWGTWCTPCVKELPYFDQIASDYADTVSVIAIHTNMVSDTAPKHIEDNYPDSNIIFAIDLDKEGYYSKLGGLGGYPYTVIFDENGHIVKSFVEALEYKDLQEAIETELSK
ncbi:MAG: 4Fe-4S binding protein [Clostridia bacterium]|nr:4Fe-4S binding protein [Clostridia bacterium]